MATNKTFPVSLDLKRSTSNRDFRLVDGDTGNKIVITLTDDGSPVNLSGCRVNAIFSHPSGTYMQSSYSQDGGVAIGGTDNNVVTIDVMTASFSSGTVNCELQVYSGSDYNVLVTTASFNFEARAALISDQVVESETSYPILTQLISRVELLNDAVDSASDDATAAAESANAASDAANAAAGSANTAAGAAHSAASGANTAKDAANAAAGSANTAAGNAGTAASAANAAAAAANTAAESASAIADSKADIAHTHTKTDITNFPETMPPSAHSHAAGDVTGVATLDANSKVTASETSAYINSRSNSYTLVLADAGKLIKMTKATASNLTVPPNSSVAFPTGTEIEILEYGAGQVTIVGGSGVTLRSAGSALKIADQYASVSLKKLGTDEWAVVGALS